MKKQMKQVAAATLAALCFGAVAIPTVASAADISVSENSTNIDLTETTLTAYKIFGITVKVDDNETPNDKTDDSSITQVDGTTVTTFIANTFKEKLGVALTPEEIAATGDTVDKTTEANKKLLDSLAQKIGDYLDAVNKRADADEINAMARTLANAINTVNKDADTTNDFDGNSGFTGATDNGTATLTGVDAGYYLVTGTTLEDDGTPNETIYSSVMLQSGDAAITITLKSDKPTITKKIVETAGLVDANTAGVGQTVDYLLTSQVPNTTYYANYTMTVTDFLSKGLTLDSNSIVVWIDMDGDGAMADTEKLTAGAENDYTVSTSAATKDVKNTPETTDDLSGTQIVIDFNDITEYGDVTANVGDAIYVEYSATVNNGAVIGDEGNPNYVKLTYSNDPNWDTDGDGKPEAPDAPTTPPTQDTPEDEVITYLTEIKIHKQDAAGTKMPNVSFTLTGKNHGVTYYVEVVNGKYTVTTQSAGADNAADTPASVTVLTDANGDIIFSGLTEDTYTITENECEGNKGYVLAQPVEIVITAKFDDAKNSTDAPTWEYNGEALVAPATIFTETIINNKGTTLPSTGGIGTTIFTVVGLSLMATAAGAYIIKRKVTAQ